MVGTRFLIFMVFWFGIQAAVAGRANGAVAAPVGDKHSPNSGKGIGLEKLVAQAVSRNESLAAFRARSESHRAAAAQAGVWAGPEGSVAVGAKRAAQTGPVLELSVGQTLPISGTLGARAAVLDLDSQIEDAAAQIAWLSVVREVVQLASAHAAADRKVVFDETRIRGLEAVRSYLAGHLFASPQKRAERGLVEARLREVARDRAEDVGARRAARAELALHTGSGETEVDLPWFRGDLAFVPTEEVDRRADASPAVRLREIQLAQAERSKNLAHAEGRPDLGLGAFYRQETSDVTDRSAGAGVTLALPSWNLNREGVRSAAERVRAELDDLSFERRRARAALRRALADFETARDAVRLYPRPVLDAAKATLAEVDLGFRKGRVDLLTFLELDAETSEAFHHALEAQHALAVAAAEVLFVVGDRSLLPEILGL